MKIKANKSIKDDRELDHLCFNHPRHKHDQKQADKLRLAHTITVPSSAPTWFRDPILFASEIATQIIYKREGPSSPERKAPFAPRFADMDQFFDHTQDRKKRASFYYGVDKRTNKPQKRLTDGLKGISVGVSPGMGRAINEALKNGTLKKEDLATTMGNIASSCMSEMHKRTGYMPVSAAVHPESVCNMHVHLVLSAVDEDNKLIGISANGLKGKKGFKHAGFSNLCQYRLYKSFPEIAPKVPNEIAKVGFDKAMEPELLAAAIKEKNPNSTARGNDDIHLADHIDKQMAKRFPQLAARAVELDIIHGKEWYAQTKEAAEKNPYILQARLAGLRKKIAQLNEKDDIKNKEITYLKSVIAGLEGQLAMYNGPEV